MIEVRLQVNEHGQGAFYAMDGGKQIGEMVIGIRNSFLTVYHTEVSDEAEGKGVAKQLLNVMVEHARQNNLKVIPLCPYVHLQFRKHPNEYADVWEREEVAE